MTETTGAPLQRWLLTAVSDLGGARRREVHARVEELFGAEFTASDRAPRQGRPGREPAWRNNLDSLYDRLKKSGDMVTGTAGSPWRLTESGQRLATAVAPPPATTEEDLLADFRPKDDSEYVAHLVGRSLIKHRAHERLLREYGTGVAEHGWRAATNVHPRDLELRRAQVTWLAEIKMLYHGNATHAVREALSQLLEYRHFLAAPSVSLVAVFNEPVGDAYVAFLEQHDVASVWRQGGLWSGSASAVAGGVVP